MSHAALSGRRVLVVEDELLIAMLVEDALGEENCTIVGPYGDLTGALQAARNEVLDLAVLDINLAGQMVFPVAEILTARGIPFLLLSGYGNQRLPGASAAWPIRAKPFSVDELMTELAGMVRAAA